MADVFISPSLDDAGSMTVDESLMSGTPVVAIETAVAVDLVQESKTGYLATPGDAQGLASGIERILGLSDAEYLQMRGQCRKLALEEHSLSRHKENLSGILQKFVS